MRDSVFDHGFCDFAFGAAQKDKLGVILRYIMNFPFINFDYS